MSLLNLYAIEIEDVQLRMTAKSLVTIGPRLFQRYREKPACGQLMEKRRFGFAIKVLHSIPGMCEVCHGIKSKVRNKLQVSIARRS